MEKRKVNTENEKKITRITPKNHLNPAHNSGNVSCLCQKMSAPITHQTSPDTEQGGGLETCPVCAKK